MICEACGIEAPTKYVSFHQNIGVLVMRFSRSAEGNLCKSCIHETFWKYTLITLAVGWFGLISLIISPFIILNNVIRYLLCLGMDPVPPGAMQPELTDAVIERLQPFIDELIDQLNRGGEFERMVEIISMKARVTKGQVAMYIRALVAASQDTQQ